MKTIESRIERLESWLQKYDCAVIAGTRRHLKNKRKKNAPKEESKDLHPTAQSINQRLSERDKSLQHVLINFGYEVYALNGNYTSPPDTETERGYSFLVVNQSETPCFFDILSDLGTVFNQDYVLFSPKDKAGPYLLATSYWQTSCGSSTRRRSAQLYAKIIAENAVLIESQAFDKGPPEQQVEIVPNPAALERIDNAVRHLKIKRKRLEELVREYEAHSQRVAKLPREPYKGPWGLGLNRPLEKSSQADQEVVDDWLKDVDCAIISSSRRHIYHCTGREFAEIAAFEVFIPKNIQAREIEAYVERCQVLNEEILMRWLSDFLFILEALKYDTLPIKGGHRFSEKVTHLDHDFLVVNRLGDPDFFKTLADLGAAFNQDAVACRPKGEKNAYLLGCNRSPFLGDGQRRDATEAFEEALSDNISRLAYYFAIFTKETVPESEMQRFRKLQKASISTLYGGYSVKSQCLRNQILGSTVNRFTLHRKVIRANSRLMPEHLGGRGFVLKDIGETELFKYTHPST